MAIRMRRGLRAALSLNRTQTPRGLGLGVAPRRIDETLAPPDVPEEIQRVISEQQQIPDVPYFRPSMIGGCLREGYFFYRKFPQLQVQRHDWRMQLILDTGTAIHSVVDKWMGKSLRYYCAPNVEVWDAELEIYGHADMVVVDRHSPYVFVIETKSINSNQYRKLGGNPRKDHRFQANIYASLLEVPWFVVLYYNKDTQHLSAKKCQTSEEMFGEALKWCDAVRDYAQAEEMPPFETSKCSEAFCRFTPICRRHRGA